MAYKLPYEKIQILNQEDIDWLIKYYDTLHKNRIQRYYNLFYSYKAEIMDNPPEWDAIRKKLELAGGNHYSYSNYFMNYEYPAFVRKHSDNAVDVCKTIVTCLDKTECEGGETIVYANHHKDDFYDHLWRREPEDWNIYRDGDDALYSDIIPHVIKQEVGDSLIYDRNTMHEVSQVMKGRRLVLITWLRNEKKN